jgi:organic hydroperoxide reductase OsmC/OhrA
MGIRGDGRADIAPRTRAAVSKPRTPMQIWAVVRNSSATHEVVVSTAGAAQALSIPTKTSGPGSSVNGGEFLMLALATCFCNDLYREAAQLGIVLDSVEVEANAEFPGVGLAATAITYRAKVSSPSPADVIADLLRRTDAVAEVHNTVRSGVPVELSRV